MTKKTIQRQDIVTNFSGCPDAAGVMRFLWDKSRNTLTEGELVGIAMAGGQVADTLEMLSAMLVQIGCVDDSAGQTNETQSGCMAGVSSVLFPLSGWLSAQAALLHASDHATCMLLQPSVYGKGQL